MYDKRTIKENRNIVVDGIVYLYAFFIIYMPRISDLLIDIPIEFFSVILLCFVSFPILLICKRGLYKIKVNKNILFLISGIILSAIYFLIRASSTLNDLRILQNTFIIIQIIHVTIIIELMRSVGYSKDDMMKLLFDLGFIQGIFCILMLIFPRFRNLALRLYYLDREENMFISRMRIFGISGDYTYFTPIYHGILASVAFFYAVFKEKKYLIYLPFILLTILLNGRFGLLIFLTGPVVALLYFLFRGKVPLKIMRYLFISIAIIIIGLSILSIISPYTYAWVIGGIGDTINLVFDKEVSGTYVPLMNKMLYFPEGVYLFIGQGHRVYSYHGTSKGYNASDIGYVNDLFMGGIMYVLILYGTILGFLLSDIPESKLNCESDKYINVITPIFLSVALLLSNYKGESLKGGTILLGVIFIKLILMQPSGVNH